ncbi:MAG: MaoC family dehydratase N-terminal domain-containing protein [Bdellovibrionales bacterium]|nr:MaoC family dehydratase N-terminal domain-containing protein [Bdellovibrionales bacterium]
MEKIYFEDFELGHKWSSVGRTITETDIVQFAGISGDYNPLHMDQEFAKEGMFGERIAHGLLGLAIASGIGDGEKPAAVMAFMSVDWKFKAPVLIGDTLHCESEILKKRAASSGDRGIVVIEKKMINQKNQVTQEGTFTLLIKNRKSEA